MKLFTSLAIALLFLVSCTQMAGPEEKDEVAKQNVELVKKVLKAYEDEDIDPIKEAYAPNCMSIGPMHDQIDSTVSWIESNIEWFETCDSIKMEIIKLLPQTVEEGDLAGDWVLAWVNVYWYEIEAGKKVVAMWHSPMRIEEGKIVYEVSYVNQWDVYKQLGAELKWPEKEEKAEE
jgi:ketosteroid isomerase-like protein